MSTTPPAPEFTPAELAHFNSLKTLLDALNTASRDPATPAGARELLQPQIDTVSDEVEDMDAIAFGRDTFDLNAEARELDPAIASLKTFQQQLKSYAQTTAALQKVAAALDQALGTAEALGL